MTLSLFDSFTRSMQNGLTCISYNHILKFVTLNKDYIKTNITQSRDKKEILCFDIYDNRYIKLRTADIQYTQILNENDISENNKIVLELIAFCKNAVNEIKQNTSLSHKEIYKAILHASFIDFSNIELAKKRINFLKTFKLSIPVECIEDNCIDEKYKDGIIDAFKSIVQVRINESTAELDELLEDCEDSDDIDDIKSIKDMFTDTLHDINTDVCINNCSDLIDFVNNQWPPLLLPVPTQLQDLQQDIDSIFDIDHDIAVQREIDNIIKQINDVVELEAFLNELQEYDNREQIVSHCMNIINDRIDYLKTAIVE